MNKSYLNYTEKVLIDRAFAARREDARIYCMKYAVEDCVKTSMGNKYVTPAAMSCILGCDMFDLMGALKQHKIAIGKLLLDGNYGNANYEVHAADKIKIQGWINFLGLPCFEDSREAKEAVKILSDLV